MNLPTNSPLGNLQLPVVPVRLDIGFDPRSTAVAAFFLMIALMIALMVFGYFFRR